MDGGLEAGWGGTWPRAGGWGGTRLAGQQLPVVHLLLLTPVRLAVAGVASCRFWPVRKYPWGSCEALLSTHSDLTVRCLHGNCMLAWHAGPAWESPKWSGRGWSGRKGPCMAI